MVRSSKAKRHNLIKKLIIENNISRQEELQVLLLKENIDVAQATISRDIRELNIVKSNDSKGDTYYHILNDSVVGLKKRTDEERLITAVADSGVSLLNIEFMNILVVLPGNGQLVGVLIDSIRTTFVEIAGCVAGDDTILILSKNREDAKVVNEYFKQFIY